MPFSTPLALAIYFTIWWVVLLALLPIGSTSYHEEGEEAPGGGDPAAPKAPGLAKKALWTTVVATIVFAIVAVIAVYVPLD